MRWGHARSDQLLVACERAAGNRASTVIRSVRTWLAERAPREKVTALIDQGSNGPKRVSLRAIFGGRHTGPAHTETPLEDAPPRPAPEAHHRRPPPATTLTLYDRHA